jgi:S1-C subfamily serine protease
VPLQNIGYAIGVQRVREVVADLRRRRSMAWLGTGLEFSTLRELRGEGLPRGILTLGATRGTPAAAAGLGDEPVLITEIDGRRLDGTLPSYCSATEGRRTGDRVKLSVVSRGGRKRQVDLRLG